MFEELWREGHTILIITHNPDIAKKTERTLTLRDGLLEPQALDRSSSG